MKNIELIAWEKEVKEDSILCRQVSGGQMGLLSIIFSFMEKSWMLQIANKRT